MFSTLNVMNITSMTTVLRQRVSFSIASIALLGIILLGLALRLYFTWDTNLRWPDNPTRLVGDEPGYDFLAMQLLEGKFFTWPGRTPVYPIFLALCYKLFGHSYHAVSYVQAFISTSSIPLTYWLALQFAGTGSALVAAGLLAIHPTLVHSSLRLYNEFFYTPLLLLVILSLVFALRQPTMRKFGLAGGLLAIANLCRPSMMLFPFFLPLLFPMNWGLKRKLRMGLAYLAAVIVVTAPWTYHNFRTHQAFIPYASGSSVLLWQGTPEFYHMTRGRTAKDIWNNELQAKNNGGHDPWTPSGDRYYKALSLKSIRQEPLLYFRYSIQKAFYYWIGNPDVDWDWPGRVMFQFQPMMTYYQDEKRVWGVLIARTIPFFAGFSLVILRNRIKLLWPLIGICLYFTLLHGLTYPEVRHSEPLQPIILIFIGMALGQIQRTWQTRLWNR
jgi:4-amino-4-deoxy-L-arabinose transferase-like glycosyltransferase